MPVLLNLLMVIFTLTQPITDGLFITLANGFTVQPQPALAQAHRQPAQAARQPVPVHRVQAQLVQARQAQQVQQQHFNMILLNPDNGAPITKYRIGADYWAIGVGETLDFSDEVGAQLKSVYGFLQEVQGGEEAHVVEVAEGFKCSNCDYVHVKKIGVLGHLKGNHKEVVEAKKAEPVGQADLTPRTLTMMRANKTNQGIFKSSIGQGDYQFDSEMKQAGVESYGPGFQEG